MSFSRTGLYGVTALTGLSLAAGAFGATLTAIEPIGSGTATDPTGVTVSPSGQAIVVGVSTPPIGPSYGGFIWDGTNGARSVLSSENAALTAALGVGYRMVNGQPQLVVQGNANGWNAEFFSNDDGLTWVKVRRDVNWPSDKSGPQFVEQNSLGISLNSSVYYTITRNSPREIYSLQCDGAGGDPPAALVSRDMKSIPSGQEASVRAASAAGLSVGSRKDADGNEQIYVYQHRGVAALPGNGTQIVAFLNGLAGNVFGQGWAVSQDGTKVFGMSPVSDGRAGNWPFMMTVSVTPKPGDPTDFDIVQTDIQELPTYPDTMGSETNAVPYGVSADGTFAAGMNYRGQERAVLWDLRDANPANWKIYDLTAYFGALGQATQTNVLGPFTRLSRAKAVAADSTKVVVVGIGATATDTRAFVATIPLSEFPLPDTGACCMIGSCTSKFAADCPNIEGQQNWTANTLCINAACPGACCHADGTCSDFVAVDACVGEGDIARGPGTSCATACQGACCDGQNTCVQENYGVCPAADFKGIGTDCANELCPCSSTYHVWADRDMDGDVDQEDFGLFQACITGPGGELEAGCECFNRAGGDLAIDEFDLSEFEGCITGPEIQWNAGLTPECNP